MLIHTQGTVGASYLARVDSIAKTVVSVMVKFPHIDQSILPCNIRDENLQDFLGDFSNWYPLFGFAYLTVSVFFSFLCSHPWTWILVPNHGQAVYIDFLAMNVHIFWTLCFAFPVFIRKGKNRRAELVLLDHGLYDFLPENNRVSLCHLYKAIIMKNEELMQHFSKELGVDGKLFSQITFVVYTIVMFFALCIDVW